MAGNQQQAPGPMGQAPQSVQSTANQTAQSTAAPASSLWGQLTNAATTPPPVNPATGAPNTTQYWGQGPSNPNATAAGVNNDAVSALMNMFFGANQAGVNFANQSLNQQQAVGLANTQLQQTDVNQQFRDIINQLGLSTTEAQQQYGQGVHNIATQGAATGTGMAATTPYATQLNTQQLQNALRGLNLQGAQAGQQRTLGLQGAQNAYADLVNQLQNQGWQNQLGAIQNIANEYLQFAQAAPYTGGYNPVGTGVGG